MKICITTPYFSEYYTQNEYDLAASLASSGHEVTVLTSAGPMRKFQGRGRIGPLHGSTKAIEGFTLERLPVVTDFPELPFTPTMVRRIQEGCFDVVHAHEDFQTTTLLSAIAARGSQTPLVLSQERYYYPRQPYGVAYRLMAMMSIRWVHNTSSLMTTHSKQAAAYLAKQGAPVDKIRHIPVGINSENFTEQGNDPPPSWMRDEDRTLFLTIARLHQNKGLEHLVRAIPEVVARNPETGFILVGRGPLLARLTRLASENNVDHHLQIVTQTVPHSSMPALYQAADAFVLPSIREPFGRSALEAAASGIPVVASSVGGLRDIVLDEETGFLVPPGCCTSLTDAICKLAESTKLRRRMGMRARRTAREVFDWSHITPQYLKTYAEAMTP